MNALGFKALRIGPTLLDAQYAVEELEETAKLHLLLRGHEIRPLTPDQQSALKKPQ